MPAANLVFLIDIQNGFACPQLTPEQGGSLYVAGGEQVGKIAAELIDASANTVFVLSQDFHPQDHISFASNHGVAPFSSIRLQANAQGIYACDPNGSLEQTAWLDHCIQGSYSALPVDQLLRALPDSLQQALLTDHSSELLSASDERHNRFHVVRKGMRRDLDSYGIATENDQLTTTGAPAVFQAIAEQLQQAGVSEVRLAIGGLATNFCVEFSHRDLYKFMLPALQACKIKSAVFFLHDISAGIPVVVPDAAWPDLATAVKRTALFGSQPSTSTEFLRLPV
jgi:nicotinamidase-related amidase